MVWRGGLPDKIHVRVLGWRVGERGRRIGDSPEWLDLVRMERQMPLEEVRRQRKRRRYFSNEKMVVVRVKIDPKVLVSNSVLRRPRSCGSWAFSMMEVVISSDSRLINSRGKSCN